jgi:hypothetical protein
MVDADRRRASGMKPASCDMHIVDHDEISIALFAVPEVPEATRAILLPSSDRYDALRGTSGVRRAEAMP